MFRIRKDGGRADAYLGRCARPVSDDDLSHCVEIIAAGGAVAIDAAKLRAATTLVVVRKGSEIVGVGAIKRIRKTYATGIAGHEKSRHQFPPETPEPGYVAVASKH